MDPGFLFVWTSKVNCDTITIELRKGVLFMKRFWNLCLLFNLMVFLLCSGMSAYAAEAQPRKVVIADDVYMVYEDHAEFVEMRGTHWADIPAYVEGVPVTVIGPYACYQKSILGIYIPETVTRIDAYAFYGTEITEITLPEQLTFIGEGAFLASDLYSIKIPVSVTEIGANAFPSHLTEVIYDGIYAQFCEISIAEPNKGIERALLNCMHSQTQRQHNNHYQRVEAQGCNEGYYRRYCECGYEDVWDFFESPYHQYEVIEEIPATCTEYGYVVYGCACGATSKESVSWELGHSYVNGRCTTCGLMQGLGFYVYNTHAEVASYDGGEADLVIPETYKGLPVTALDVTAFYYDECESLRTITLPDTLRDFPNLGYFATNIVEFIVGDGNPAFTAVDGAV